MFLPHVPVTVSPVLSRVTCAYTGSSSIGPETSATHMPAISAADASKRRNARRAIQLILAIEARVVLRGQIVGWGLSKLSQ